MGVLLIALALCGAIVVAGETVTPAPHSSDEEVKESCEKAHSKERVACAKDNKTCVFGVVDVSKSLNFKSGKHDALFIIVRKPGHDSSPPLAVVRIPKPEFPQKFDVGP